MTARNLVQALPGGRLGAKHKCSCGKSFYDLNRKPATCPACGTEAVPPDFEEMLRRTRSRNRTRTSTIAVGSAPSSDE